jgi:hypothetical protein
LHWRSTPPHQWNLEAYSRQGGAHSSGALVREVKVRLTSAIFDRMEFDQIGSPAPFRSTIRP